MSKKNRPKKKTLEFFKSPLKKGPSLGFASFYACLALVAITWLVFGQTLRHDFFDFDDNVYVYHNPVITRVRPLCAQAVCRALSGRSIVPRARSDVETHAGDSALRAFASRLLAAKEVFREAHASCPREDSAACAVRSLLHSDFAGTALCQRIHGPVTVHMATE